MPKDNKKLVVESIFIKEALKRDLSLEEFLLLLYFDNAYDGKFDIKIISKVLNMSEEAIITAYSKLMSKKVITVKAEKNESGKVEEKVSLDNFYNEIKMDIKTSEKKESKEDIFSIFENSFGRTLSGMDAEVINAWIDKGFSEELIKVALKEAVYNGAPNLRYIDKILHEWNRKGIKEVDDIKTKLYNDAPEDKLFETSVFNFDWLNEK